MDRERTKRKVHNMNSTLAGEEAVVAHKLPEVEVVAGSIAGRVVVVVDSMAVVLGIGVAVSDLFQAILDGEINRHDENAIPKRRKAHKPRTRVLVNLPRHRRLIIARLFRHRRYLNDKRPADKRLAEDHLTFNQSVYSHLMNRVL